MDDLEFLNLLRKVARRMKKKIVGCFDVQTLLKYHQEELSKTEAQKVREHLALCSNCVQELQQIMQFFEIVEETPQEVPTPDEERFETLMGQMGEAAVPGDKKRSPFIDQLSDFIDKQFFNFKALAYVGLVIIVSLAGLRFYAYSQKPTFWERPEYQQLIEPRLHQIRNLADQKEPAETLQDQVRVQIQNGEYARAKSLMESWLQTHDGSWNDYRLAGLATLLTARKKFIFDFYFDKGQVHQAIAYFQQAQKRAQNNLFAQEELLWLLGQAYVMLDDLAVAEINFQAILQLQAPGLTRQADARRALQNLQALTTLP